VLRPASEAARPGVRQAMASELASLGARLPMLPEKAGRLAWLAVGAMLVATIQPLPQSAGGIALALLAAMTSLAAAVCVIALDTPAFRLERVAAGGFGVLLWLGGLAVLGSRISWWFFGLSSVVLLVSALALLRD